MDKYLLDYGIDKTVKYLNRIKLCADTDAGKMKELLETALEYLESPATMIEKEYKRCEKCNETFNVFVEVVDNKVERCKVTKKTCYECGVISMKTELY